MSAGVPGGMGAEQFDRRIDRMKKGSAQKHDRVKDIFPQLFRTKCATRAVYGNIE